MSNFASNLLPTIKLSLRETSVDFDSEIKSYIDGCVMDLKNAGILSSYFSENLTDQTIDPQILQAIRLYCLTYFGLYNTDSDKYDKAYRSIKSTLCTQQKYIKE